MTARMPITWIDVETMGVDANENELLEVACLITDTELNILDEVGYQATVYFSPEDVLNLKSKAGDFIIDMHSKTDLWSRLSTEGKSLEQVDNELFAYIKTFIPEWGSRLAGNSITLDRNFINANLPLVAEHLTYRSFDVSTIAGLAQAWYGEDVVYQKKTLHSADSDIRESIEELRFLRNRVFA